MSDMTDCPSCGRPHGKGHLKGCAWRRLRSTEEDPKIDRHLLQGWYSQAISIANQIFHIALDGRVTRRRLLDLSETLEGLANRIGRAAGNAD